MAEHVAQPSGHGLAAEELPAKETCRRCRSVKEVHAITHEISAGGWRSLRGLRNLSPHVLSGYYQEKQIKRCLGVGKVEESNHAGVLTSGR